MDHSNETYSFGYQYGLFNKKFTEKELEVGIKVVAVKIVNKSNSSIMYGKDFDIKYFNGESLKLATDSEFKHHFQQVGANEILPNLFYFNFAAAPMLINNIILAKSSNKKINNEFNNNKLVDKVIMQNDTLYGLIPLKTVKFTPLKLYMN